MVVISQCPGRGRTGSPTPHSTQHTGGAWKGLSQQGWALIWERGPCSSLCSSSNDGCLEDAALPVATGTTALWGRGAQRKPPNQAQLSL